MSLTQRGFVRLAGAIGGDFDRPDGVRATAAARGLYPDSAFYRAHGAFSLFNTCNTWTAKKLRAAGIDIVPSGITTADELMTRLRAALATARP